MNTATLAAMMNVSEPDLAGFLAGLKVWTDKGYSVEQAIDRHLATLSTLLNNVSEGFSRVESIHHAPTVALKGVCASLVWDSVNGGVQ